MESTPRDDLKIYSPGEIEIFLSGDRREVDRLLLHGLNNLAAVLLPHAKHEEEREAEFLHEVEELGGFEMIKKRAAFIDGMIKSQEARISMMEKVSQSSVAYALIAFLGFLGYSIFEAIVAAIRHKLGGS